jgi:death on curing protein
MASSGNSRPSPVVSYAERNRVADGASAQTNWIRPAECIVIHDLLLVRYGGVPGLRDEAALGVALAIPQERFAAGCHSLAKLATAYLLALTEKQPFQSGNLAVAFLVAITFLRVNGRVFSSKEVDVAEDTANLADGKCPESFYTHWLYAHTCQ